MVTIALSAAPIPGFGKASPGLRDKLVTGKGKIIERAAHIKSSTIIEQIRSNMLTIKLLLFILPE